MNRLHAAMQNSAIKAVLLTKGTTDMKIMIIFENVPDRTDVYLVDDNDGNRNMADVSMVCITGTVW